VTALTPVFRDRALSFFNFYIHHRRYIKLWTLARKDLRRLHWSATHGVSQNGGLFREKARASINRPTSPFFKEDLPGLQPFDPAPANVSPGVASRVAQLLAFTTIMFQVLL
jgi:hypothetical protein